MEPSYIALYDSGELENRVNAMESRLAVCDICPRKCGVNRLIDQYGFCHSGRLPIISSYCDHHGEEPVLSGINGSGTIFFGNCNMKCVYCQNYQISQKWKEQKKNEMECQKLAEIMLSLQNDLRCHNINLVSPSHFVPQILHALLFAIPAGLRIPLVYNTNAYDSLETLAQLNNVVDIYLPDLRYASNKFATKYSLAAYYVKYARKAIQEMYKQVGNLVIDEYGVASRGLIIRLLILPNEISGTCDSLQWIGNKLSTSITLSIMSQYNPVNKAAKYPLLSRTIKEADLIPVINRFEEMGFENGWIQELESSQYYLPDFERDGHPFSM